jgi:hypothetical protein
MEGDIKMILKSKKTVISMTVAVVLFVGYVIYAFSNSAPASDDLSGWALLILKFIIVCVVAEIMVHILSGAVFSASLASKEKGRDKITIKRIILNEMSEDEMDERITLKSSHVGYGVVGVGFVLTLIAVAFFDISAVLVLNLILAWFFLSQIANSCLSVCLYEIGENGSGRDCDE